MSRQTVYSLRLLHAYHAIRLVARVIPHLLGKLDIKPSLLHGDLWVRFSRSLAGFLSPEAADHSCPYASSHSRLCHNLTGHCFPCKKQSGNARFSRSRSQPIIFDPASYYGHSEADLGIMHMFGGFTPAFFERYHQLVPRSEPTEEYEQRVQLYEAYHHLNHALMFGVRTNFCPLSCR